MKPLIQVQAVSQRFHTASGEFLALLGGAGKEEI